MKSILFTKSETDLLITLLKGRQDSFKELFSGDLGKADGGRHHNFYIKPLVSAFGKLSTYTSCAYTSREKLVFISCVNEQYDSFLKELQLSTAFSWLAIADHQRNVIQKLDDCRSILVKCGYPKGKYSYSHFDPDFRYGNVLSAADKLKQSEKILLSRVGENDFYKIGFVYNDEEYATFELKDQISWRDFRFSPLYESAEILAKRKFSMITNKNKARTLFATVDRTAYPEGVLNCMEILLQEGQLS